MIKGVFSWDFPEFEIEEFPASPGKVYSISIETPFSDLHHVWVRGVRPDLGITLVQSGPAGVATVLLPVPPVSLPCAVSAPGQDVASVGPSGGAGSDHSISSDATITLGSSNTCISGDSSSPHSLFSSQSVRPTLISNHTVKNRGVSGPIGAQVLNLRLQKT